jgi:hypothetical protein
MSKEQKKEEQEKEFIVDVDIEKLLEVHETFQKTMKTISTLLAILDTDKERDCYIVLIHAELRRRIKSCFQERKENHEN